MHTHTQTHAHTQKPRRKPFRNKGRACQPCRIGQGTELLVLLEACVSEAGALGAKVSKLDGLEANVSELDGLDANV